MHSIVKTKHLLYEAQWPNLKKKWLTFISLFKQPNKLRTCNKNRLEVSINICCHVVFNGQPLSLIIVQIFPLDAAVIFENKTKKNNDSWL